MRFRHSLIAYALLLTGLAAYAQQVPRPAGEFAVKMPNGQITLLSQYAGKVVVLAFISTTCPHCQHTTGVLSAIQNEYAARGVQIVAAAFNPDAAPTLQEPEEKPKPKPKPAANTAAFRIQWSSDKRWIRETEWIGIRGSKSEDRGRRRAVVLEGRPHRTGRVRNQSVLLVSKGELVSVEAKATP